MPRQDKAVLQKLYREEERECFDTLRALIYELTGEELQTRHEILQKAIGLLLAASELRKLKEAQAIRPTPSQTRALTTQAVTSSHNGHPAGLAQWPYGWGPTTGLDSHPTFQSYNQVEEQYHAFNADSALNQTYYPGYEYPDGRSDYS